MILRTSMPSPFGRMVRTRLAKSRPYWLVMIFFMTLVLFLIILISFLWKNMARAFCSPDQEWILSVKKPD